MLDKFLRYVDRYFRAGRHSFANLDVFADSTAWVI